ncbi:hypothetical protein D7252_08735 [Microbacterium sp. CGR2]|nr:hypothetical protein D7252_08735 [Microbacterium sp. CGR2]
MANTFTLTDTELACGVTLGAVHAARDRGLVRDERSVFVAERHQAPAVAGAAARMALGGPVEFSHLAYGCPVYRLVRA